MTPTERSILEKRRNMLVTERDSALKTMHQAIGAIAMIDAVLNLPQEVPADQPQAANQAA